MGKDDDKAVGAASAPGLEEALQADVQEAAGQARTGAKEKVGKGTISAHLFAIAALVASVGNLVHGGDQQVTHFITRDDSITENAYETLSKSIDEQGQQLTKTQGDVQALRNFLAGYLQAVPPGVRYSAPGAPTVPKPGEIENLLPKAAKPRPSPKPPSYQSVRDKSVDEPPIQVEKKE